MGRSVSIAIATLLSILVATGGVTVIGSTLATAQGDASATVSVHGEETVSAGNTTTVSVQLDSRTEIYAAQFTLSVEPTTVDIVGSSQGSYLAQNGSSLVVINDINGSSATYGETRIQSESGVSGTGTLTDVVLDIPENIGSDTVSLRLTEVEVVDPAVETVPTSVENGSLSVRGVSTDTTQPSPTPADEAPADDSGDAPDAGGGGDESAPTVTTPTAESATPSPSVTAWESNVDQRVIEDTEASGSSQVLVQLASSAPLQQTSDDLNESGLRNVSVNSELRVVQGDVDQDSLSAVANVSGVERVRYDSTGQSQATPGETEWNSTDGSAEQPSTAERNTSAETTTGGSGAGFTALLSLISVGSCVLLALRRASS